MKQTIVSKSLNYDSMEHPIYHITEFKIVAPYT